MTPEATHAVGNGEGGREGGQRAQTTGKAREGGVATGTGTHRGPSVKTVLLCHRRGRKARCTSLVLFVHV